MPEDRLHTRQRGETDVYFSADVETDGPIPGPYSMLSLGLVAAGSFDGQTFVAPESYDDGFYVELQPISDSFDAETLAVSGLDRDRLAREGVTAGGAMDAAASWVLERTAGATPVLVAYPLSFDWAWLYWYFTRFASGGSPFGFSRCFDMKTALAVKARRPIARSGHSEFPAALRGARGHSHHALDDAVEQAQMFANLFGWRGE